jgi:phage shock protein A
MGFFQRLATLIKSNLNDLISRSEDPERMLNQIVEDMTTQLGEAKKMVALSIADEKRLEKQTQQELEAAAGWEKRAMLAVKAGIDRRAIQGPVAEAEDFGRSTEAGPARLELQNRGSQAQEEPVDCAQEAG